MIFAAISAIEQALWDIKGKALGVPVSELLGERFAMRVRVYANGWSYTYITAEEDAPGDQSNT
jgi:galactonate dehydratase